MLETPTWRANPDWAPARVRRGRAGPGQPGGDRAACTARASVCEPARPTSRSAVSRTARRRLRRRRGADPDEAAEYHAAQVALVRGGRRRPGPRADDDRSRRGDRRRPRGPRRRVCRSAISFTVETDGRLPDGTTLKRRDRRASTPQLRPTTTSSTAPTRPMSRRRWTAAPWQPGSRACRPNASTDVARRARRRAGARLGRSRPARRVRTTPLRQPARTLRIVGGCCGTDSRHVAALWGVG